MVSLRLWLVVGVVVVVVVMVVVVGGVACMVMKAARIRRRSRIDNFIALHRFHLS